MLKKILDLQTRSYLDICLNLRNSVPENIFILYVLIIRQIMLKVLCLLWLAAEPIAPSCSIAAFTPHMLL